MRDFRDPKLIAPAYIHPRFKIAAFCGLASILVMIFAVRYQTTEFLTSIPGEHRADRSYSRMWFDSNDALAGVVQKENKLTVDRWTDGGSSEGTSRVDLSGRDPQWAMAADLSRVAWVSDKTLHTRMLFESNGSNPAEVTVALPDKLVVLALGVLFDGSVSVVFADSSVGRWDGATGNPLGKSQLLIKEPDQAVINGDYLAVSSSRAGQMLMNRFRTGEDWKLVEESPVPDPPYRLIVPAPGLMATLTAAGMRIAGETRNSPGAIQSAVSRVDNVIAAGDFDNVFVLPAKGAAFYRLADAPPGSLIAAGRTHLAISGRGGTTLLGLRAENRLTAMGRSVSLVSALLIAFAILLALSPLLMKGFAILFTPKGRQVKVSDTFVDPSPQLVQACSAGEAVLWAGAGLSAHSGFPLRQKFITTLLQMAAVEKWVDPVKAQKLVGDLGRSDAEGVLNELVAKLGRIRSDVIQEVRIATRFSSASAK